MPWFRDRSWKSRGYAYRIDDPRERIVFDPDNEGLVEVKRLATARRLEKMNGIEVAWEKHGVFFDEAGIQVEATSGNGKEKPKVEEPVKAAPKRGRPRKR